MAFKLSPQSLLRASPSTTTELLGWASQHHHTSSNTTNHSQILKGFIIPNVATKLSGLWTNRQNQRHETWILDTSSCKTAASCLNSRNCRGIRYQSSASNITSAATTTTATTATTNIENRSNFLLDTSKDRLSSLLSQTKYTPKDLDQLAELAHIILTSVTTSSSQFNEFILKNKPQIYEVLLRYRRYETLMGLVRTKDQSSWDYQDTMAMIRVFLLTKQSSSQIPDLIQTLSASQLKRFTSDITEYFTTINKKPMRALEFWLYATSKVYPDMKIANHPLSRQFMDQLKLILSKVNIVNDVLTLGDQIIVDPLHTKNLNVTLSFAYLRAGKHRANVELWLLSDEANRSVRQCTNTIRSYFALNQHEKAYQLWLSSPERADSVALSHVNPSLEYIPDMNHVSHDTLRDVLRTGLIKDSHFKQLIFKVISQDPSNSVKPAYQLYQAYLLGKNQEKESIEMINIFLEHSKITEETDFFQTKMIQLGPNARSFLIILKDFTKSKDLTSALNLVEVLSQHERATSLLKVDHFTELLNLLIIRSANEDLVDDSLIKLRRFMRSTKIEPDQRFVERLITLKWQTSQYATVRSIFNKYVKSGIISEPTVGLLGTVMKALFKLKDMEGVQKIWSQVEDISVEMGKDSGYYIVKLEYLAQQGKISEMKIIIDQIMPSDGIIVNARHQHVLLSALNRKKMHMEVVEEYTKISESNVPVIKGILHRDLLVALVKLEIINRGNFDKPKAIVEQFLKSTESQQIKFKVIKPLINSLTRFHQRDQALKLIKQYEKSQTDNAVINTMNLIKQKLLVFSTEGYQTKSNQETFKVLFNQFQDVMREILSEQDRPPSKLKKIYVPLIKPLIRYYERKRNLKEFASMFNDLVFIHKFTFDSTTYNYAARHLLKYQSTFHKGLSLIENKLIGGYIANTNLKLRQSALKAKYGSQARQLIRSPTIAWGVLTRENNVNMIYNYILRTVRRTTNVTMDDIIEKELKVQYPKLMKNVERKLRMRFKARDRALERKDKNPEDQMNKNKMKTKKTLEEEVQ